MSTFGTILRDLRKSENLTQKQLAQSLGLSFSTISMYERGDREPDFETMEAIADYFNVDMNFLYGLQLQKHLSSVHDSTTSSKTTILNILPLPKTKKIPLLGTIACGEPITAEENIDQHIDVAENIRCTFALRCKGDSMIEARILDGDVVYIREQPQVENGEIAAVLIGDEATLKRVYITESALTLMPANSAYQPIMFFGEDMNNVRILGKAVAFTSVVK